MALMLGLIVGLGRVPVAEAGIWNADEEVTYKEYWIPHTQFTAGCTEDGQPISPGGSWYSEPESLTKCPKTMLLNIPDDISGALKAEVYVDIWRGYDTISPRLRINNGATIYQPPVAYDWSRTPWVFEVPLASLAQGTNSFLFWAAGSRYHIHDVGVRVYYDATHPLVGGGVSPDVTAPTGHLVSIKSGDPGSVVIPAMDGGQLMVNSDLLTLEAQVDMPTDSTWVEFHAYYDGYDDDNDGLRRDWHNVGHNNWFPGGKPGTDVPKFGGVINHIGSVKPDASGKATINWSLPHIVNQSGVRFKIRLIDASGNAREGAGGVTPDYSLVRNFPVVYYTMPGFDDFGLHMDGLRPDIVSYTFPLPDDIDMGAYNQAYLVGMYWRRPKFSINGSSAQPIRQGGDDWELGVRQFSKSLLTPGNNRIDFLYSGSGQGQFIEHPGPMIVLRGNSTNTPDTTGPYVISRTPTPNSVNVDVFSPVSFRLGDIGVGIDSQSIIMSVDNVLVEPVLTGAYNNLTVTFEHETPFPPLATIPVTIYACDLFNNCMTSAEEFSFTTEPPDTTPPIISNINVLTTENTATITWLTDEGATSLIDYGLTPAYDTTVSDNELVKQHTIELTNLTPLTTYNFRITSADYSNNTATTTNLVFTTKRVPGAIVSDDFSSCTLDTSVWSFINPKNDAALNLTGSEAQIFVPSGSSHDLWKSGLLAPRLTQYVTNQDNFGVEVKFDSPVSKRAQSMGVFIKQDDGNWLRFNYQNDGVGLNSLVAVNSNKGNPALVFSTPVTMGSSAYMRINRIGGTIWNLEYSMDGTNWSFATTLTRTLNMTEIGPYVGNTSQNPEFTGIIDYFENLAAPLSGNEAPLQLNVHMDGVGTVTRVPDKPSYLCGETVSVTAAVNNPDWTFAGWSGAINSTNATESITLYKTEDVTATFTNDHQYLLNINVVSQGNGVGGEVLVDPDQGSYLYGTPVKLEAKPTPGWSFLGWTGDWTGTELTPTVPITGNMNITATFKEDVYTIQTLILTDGFGDGGTIDVDPLKAGYLYGEAVTLTVNVNPGWSFVGWEGSGVSGTEPVVNLNMSQNVLAVARLAQNKYNLNVTIDDGGAGNPNNVVERIPDQETYGHGEVVTLTAKADLGWAFTGWSGDLTGTEPTKTLTITESKDITATYTQDQYALTVTVNNPAYGSVTIDPVKPYYVYGDVVKLTPVPAQGYDFATWTGDNTTTADPLIIPVTGNVTVEAVFEVDTTPIEIIDHKITIINTVAVVEWTTDVPGTSSVDYGEDALFGSGTISDDTLVTSHKITLTNLKGETRYYYQITSENVYGEPVQSSILTFFTGTSSGLASDDFSACDLNANIWTFVNPLADSSNYGVTGHQLEIFAPAEDQQNVHNIFTGGMDVPRLMQVSNDRDFTVEVKFDSVLSAAGTIQGIVIEQDANNFMRFDTFLRIEDNQEQVVVVYAAGFKDLALVNPKNSVKLTDVNGPFWMRVVRIGDDWQQWYSLDGVNWTKSYQFTFDLEVKKVGVFAGNTLFKGVLSEHTAVIDYFFNTAAPIDPEDSRFDLSFTYEGSGSVQKSPNKSGYYCGEQVTLTAVPTSGWGFVGWGDIPGTNPTRVVTVNEDMTILARFQQGVVSNYKLLMPVVIDRP